MRCFKLFATTAIVLSGFAMQAQMKFEYRKPHSEPIVVLDDQNVVGAPGLPLLPVELQQGDTSRGMCFYAVTIQPGQTLRISDVSRPVGQVYFNFMVPMDDYKDKKDPFYKKLKSTSDTQNRSRRNFIQLKNETDVPQQVMFLVSGDENQPYSMAVERK